MSNRRASLEWALETTGKLVIYAFILIGIFIFTAKITDIFKGGDEAVRAERNVDLLQQRVELTKAMQQSTATIILQIPNNYFLRSYDAGQDAVDAYIPK